VTPREEFEGPAEKGVAPTRISDPSGVVYRKRFGYGSNRIDLVGNYEKAKGFKARQGDRTPLGNHTPVRFGWTSSTEINFAELVRGSKIFIFTEANRGGGPAGQAAKLATRPIRFPTNIYTVQSNVSGQLEFYEGIDSSSWEGDQGPLYYKASFVPSAVRITLRVVDDDARNPRTVQRLIWVRAKTR
jgi:hypothetical protein